MSSQAKKRSGGYRDKAGDCERDAAPASSPRPSPHSNRLRPQPIYQFNGDVSIKGNVTIGGRANNEIPPRSPRSSPLSARSHTRLARPKGGQPVPLSDDDESESSMCYSSRQQSPAPLVPHPLKNSKPPNPIRAPKQIDHDEGYGTASTRKSERSKRPKLEEIHSEHDDESNGSPSMVSLEKSEIAKKSKKSDPLCVESDAVDEEDTLDDTNLANQDDDEERENLDDDSDDDFGKITMKLRLDKNKEIELRGIIDTGTKSNWVGRRFLDDEVKEPYTRLSDKENKDYRDFNSKKFKAVGQVELSVFSDDFTGFPCRDLTFLVSQNSTFKILIGRDTTKAEGLLLRRIRDISGEGTYPGFLEGTKKEDKKRIAQKKAEQKKDAEEQARKREEKRKAESKGKQNSGSQASTSQPECESAQPAYLASESRPRRNRSRSRSVSSSHTHRSLEIRGKSPLQLPKTTVDKKTSLSSMEGTW